MKNRKKQVKLPGYEDETMQKDREKKTQTLYQILLDSSDDKKEVAQVTGYVPGAVGTFSLPP